MVVSGYSVDNDVDGSRSRAVTLHEQDRLPSAQPKLAVLDRDRDVLAE